MTTSKLEASEQNPNLSSNDADIDSPTVPKDDDDVVRTIHGIKWFLAYSSLLSTVLFYALDGTIVS